MHNGEIAEFSKIKRKLQATLSDEIFDSVKGNTGKQTHGKDSPVLLLMPLRQIQNGLLPYFSQRWAANPVIEGTRPDS